MRVERLVGRRIAQVELLQMVRDSAGHEPVAHILVVCRHDVPGRPLRVRVRENAVIGLRELVPSRAVVEIAGAKLPMLRLVGETLLESRLLVLSCLNQE
jgi:hypothetical protein